jgi:hypothetical protein
MYHRNYYISPVQIYAINFVGELSYVNYSYLLFIILSIFYSALFVNLIHDAFIFWPHLFV